MLVPLSWLRDFAPFDLDPARLGETLDDLGMVVQGIQRVGEGLEGVVVAEVQDIRAIEGLDRVRLVTVDAGGESLEVACGAWNFDVGDRVPLATVGTTLPNGMTIGRRKLRGVVSNGMLCSPDELGMSGGHDGLLVLGGLTDADPGTPFADAMGLAADVVYDLAIETNRPDAMSVAGIARDLAARLRLPFVLPEPRLPEDGERTADVATVVVESSELCPRFTATAVTGVHVGPSSREVRRRLTLAGMRPINNVVDASNYVMLELGQPTHPYDLDRLPGPGLLVRRARPGEVVATLDGVERRVGDGDDCLICDAEGNPVGIAGIMGGASSEISAATTRVLLEAAYFSPMAIARTAKRLGLRSEASARFERGCDPEGIERAVARFCELLGTGRPASAMLDVRTIPTRRDPVLVRTARVNAILGTDLADEQIATYLAPLGFASRPVEAGLLEVELPTFRPDATSEIDVIEEVGRHHGYSKIVRTVPRSPYVGRLTPFQSQRRRVRDVLAGAGVNEAMGSPLLGPGDHERAGIPGSFLEAVDPLAKEESILRASLLPGLLRSVASNVAHREPEVSLFEIGHVFRPGTPGEALPEERETLGVVLAGSSGGVIAAKRTLDVLLDGIGRRDVRLEASAAPGLHATRTARLVAGGVALGWVGEVDPAVVEAFGIPGRVGWIEVELAGLLPAERTYAQARPLSRLPSADIDLAFAVDEGTPAAAVQATLQAAGSELLVGLRLFDVFRGPGIGEGRRSLAFRLRLQALDRTLTDEEIAQVRRRCIDAVEEAHPAQLRG